MNQITIRTSRGKLVLTERHDEQPESGIREVVPDDASDRISAANYIKRPVGARLKDAYRLYGDA